MDVKKCSSAMKLSTDDDNVFQTMMSEDAMGIYNQKQNKNS